MPASKQNLFLVLFALLALRVTVGLHFYSEGVAKIRGGDFTSEGFLRQANGPWAGFFKGLLDDHDGRIRLCVLPEQPTEGVSDRIDTEQTFAIWQDYLNHVGQHFEFDSDQLARARIIVSESERYLTDWFALNEAEILAWMGQANRLDGFSRDGDRRNSTFREIAGLHDHMNSIRQDRYSKAKSWYNEIENVWDELEARLNAVHEPDLPDSEWQRISRPWQSRPVPILAGFRWSPQRIIDTSLPWFDAIVGTFLVIGLGTRMAALLGLGLLLGVVATQPFWVLGSQNTYYQWVEITALLVVFATAAGRFGGLDYFFWRRQSENNLTGENRNGTNS